ncbi:hypothetical protein A9Z42_0065750 [Trichoderma parareesei]|uniref:Uncharacterized protein n=1 Tax=Trichoderma parareesei TaxID=858221 RepID=A0A2H2ZG51_TRIPA|nr:hypothetical protein A9Z42_0065750 [Trichoderma parareesei]
MKVGPELILDEIDEMWGKSSPYHKLKCIREESDSINRSRSAYTIMSLLEQVDSPALTASWRLAVPYFILCLWENVYGLM